MDISLKEPIGVDVQFLDGTTTDCGAPLCLPHCQFPTVLQRADRTLRLYDNSASASSMRFVYPERGRGRWIHLSSAAVLLLLLLPNNSVLAQTTDGIASGCPGGTAAVSAEVLDTSGGRPVVSGRLADVGMEVSIGGMPLNISQVTEVPVGTDLTVSLGGNELNFLEFLVRVEDATDGDDLQLMLTPQANAQVAEDCIAAGVMGLTNIDLEEKTLSTGTLRSENEGLVNVDVTVVFLNSPVGSAYLFDTYQIRFVPAPGTFTDDLLVPDPPPTGDMPAIDGGLVSSVGPPLFGDAAGGFDGDLPDGLISVFDHLDSLSSPTTATTTDAMTSGSGGDSDPDINNSTGGATPPPAAFDGLDTGLLFSMTNPLLLSANGGSSPASSPGGAGNGGGGGGGRPSSGGGGNLPGDDSNPVGALNMRRGMMMMRMKMHKMGMMKGKGKKNGGKMGGNGRLAAKYLHQLDQGGRPLKGGFFHPSDTAPRQQQRAGRPFQAPRPKKQRAPRERI